MTSVVKRKNNQRMRWMFIGFGFLMLLYAASKNPNLPTEWTGMHKVESGNQTPKSSSECGSD
jgi:hypothetical protein